MSSVEELSELIGAIYDCAIDPERWPATLDGIRAPLNLANGVLAANALPSGEASIFVSVGVEPDWLARIHGYGTEVLALWGGPARAHQYPFDEPILQSQATNPATWKGNRWYEEWVRPQDLIDAVAFVFARDRTMVGNVTFGRHRAAGAIGDTEMAALRLIAPHVRRSVAISRLLDLQAIASSNFEAALETLAVAVILVDDELKIVHANLAGKAMLAAGDPIASHHGSLRLPSPVTTDALQAAVTLAARNENELGRRGIGIPIRQAGETACVAHVLPLSRRKIRRDLVAQASAAVFIAPAQSPPRMPADALALLYDLTPAEQRIFESIAEGQTPAEIGRTLGIAPSTVKTHLLHVFEKTGCSRQADLVRLAASLTLPL